MDPIVLDRLLKATRSQRSDVIVIGVMVIIFAAISIIAALRQSAWWLCSLLPLAVAVYGMQRLLSLAPAEERLLTFTNARDGVG